MSSSIEDRKATYVRVDESKLQGLFTEGRVQGRKAMVPSSWALSATSLGGKNSPAERRRTLMIHVASALGVTSIFFAVLENEVFYVGGSQVVLGMLKLPVMLCSIALGFIVIMFYAEELQKLRKNQVQVASVQFLSFVGAFLIEFFVCTLHSPPTLNYSISFPYADQIVEYNLDSLAVIPISCRVYLLLRSFREFFSFKDTQVRFAAQIADVDVDSTAFTLKIFLETNPFTILIFFFFLTLVWAAYLIRISEIPYDRDTYGWYWNCLWLIIVTVSTVGYGDITPQTHLGRLSAFLAMAVGLVLSSLLISVFANAVSLSPSESRFVEQADDLLRRASLQVDAVRFVQAFYRAKMAASAKKSTKVVAKLRVEMERAMQEFRANRQFYQRQHKTSKSFAELTISAINDSIEEFKKEIDQRQKTLEQDIASINEKLQALQAYKRAQTDLIRQILELCPENIIREWRNEQ